VIVIGTQDYYSSLSLTRADTHSNQTWILLPTHVKGFQVVFAYNINRIVDETLSC
jgi:hypothetical protein